MATPPCVTVTLTGVTVMSGGARVAVAGTLNSARVTMEPDADTAAHVYHPANSRPTYGGAGHSLRYYCVKMVVCSQLLQSRPTYGAQDIVCAITVLRW